jgi:hypothetical protein
MNTVRLPAEDFLHNFYDLLGYRNVGHSFSHNTALSFCSTCNPNRTFGGRKLIIGAETNWPSKVKRKSHRVMIGEGGRNILMPNQRLTPAIISAAIDGFEAQKVRIDAQIAELRAMLEGRPRANSTSEAPKRKRGRMSAAGRRAIAAAQRARWAKLKGEKTASPKAAKSRRKLSAKGRANIVAALKKRWAAKRAEAAKG